MIIIKLKGGLGNQLFQYAFGRSIALKNKAELVLDAVNGFRHDPFSRSFALEPFKINARIAGTEDVRRIIPGSRIASKLFRVYQNSIVPFQRRSYVKERSLEFDRKIFDLKLARDVYCDGYWQSEKYFLVINEVLWRELTLKKMPDLANRNWLDLIGRSESVSVHLRRYDQPGMPNTESIYGKFEDEYFHSAMSVIRERVKSPVYFIFSHDMAWARNMLKETKQTYFIDTNSSINAHEDLRLMMSCKHNIISNSSFSWWGAWLNRNAHKVVIAPKQWRTGNQSESNAIVPEGWETI
jgi:hypothetical protein